MNWKTRNQGHYDVAISFCERDESASNLARDIQKHLAAHGLTVFYYRSEEDIQKSLGKDIQNILQQNFSTTSHVVAIFSENYSLTKYTSLEWNTIQQRKPSHNTSDITCILTCAASDLPSSLASFGAFELLPSLPENDREHLFQSILKTILLKFGVDWQCGIAAWGLFLSLVFLWLLLMQAYFVSAIEKTIVSTFCALSLLWIFVSCIVPASFPRTVYSPRSLFALMINNIFLHRLRKIITTICFIGLALALGVYLYANGRRSEVAVQDWISGTETNRTKSLRFFRNDLADSDALNIWLGILINHDGRLINNRNYSPRDRGLALDMVCNLLLKDDEGIAFVPQQIKNYYQTRNLRLDSYRNALCGLDIGNIRFSNVDFSLLTFSGGNGEFDKTTFKNTSFESCNFSGGYFSLQDYDSAVFSNCNLTSAVVIGGKGKVSFSNGAMPQSTWAAFSFSKGSRLYGEDMTSTHMSWCTFDSVDFSNSDFVGAHFQNCKFHSTIFADPNVKWRTWGRCAGMIFESCEFSGVNFMGCDFSSKRLPSRAYRSPSSSDESKTDLIITFYPPTRFTESPKAEGSGFVVDVPSATFIDCRFSSDVSFRGCIAKGMFIDEKSYTSLSPTQKQELINAGLDTSALKEVSGSGKEIELVDRYPELAEQLWPTYKLQISNEYMTKYSECVPPHSLQGPRKSD